MSLLEMSVILLGALFIFFIIGLEIPIAMGIVGSIGMLLFVKQPIHEFAFTAFDYMNSFVLTTIPLFVFMGAILANTGVIRSLFDGAEKLVGSLPGGVACSVIVANAVFGAMSGSSVAAAATFGTIAYPEMERLGYSPRLSLGSIAVAGTLAVLIPPSIIMIVYAGWEHLSLVRLFAAGIFPGIVLTILLMLTVIIIVKLNPALTPKPVSYSWKERFIALRYIAPFIALILLVLGLLFGGIMTPTESAAIGSILAIILALAYRKLSFSAFKESMWTTVKINAMIAFIVITAKVLGQVFQYIGLTEATSTFMLGMNLGRYGMFAIICILYLVLGCFFDSFSMLVLTLPFVSPIIEQIGFDAVWFGVVYVVLAEIGLITPPFGLNLFVLNSVVPQHSVMEVARGSMPLLIPCFVLIAVLLFLPDLALWLPKLLY